MLGTRETYCHPQRLNRYMSARKSIPTKLAVAIPGLSGIAYGVSPIDLIPDFLPIIGLMDDLGIVPTLLIISAMLLVRRRRMLAMQGAQTNAQNSVPPVIQSPA